MYWAGAGAVGLVLEPGQRPLFLFYVLGLGQGAVPLGTAHKTVTGCLYAAPSEAPYMALLMGLPVRLLMGASL